MTWREQALCQGADLELFFAPERESTAREWCYACPVRDACLADAYRCHDLYGVRGGMTPQERQKHISTLDDSTTDKLLVDYARLRKRSLTQRVIAQRLGLSYHALLHALGRARKAGKDVAA
jgi:hypothetical protein